MAAVSPLGMKLKPVEKKINQTVLRLAQGDLTAMAVDAFVFYAREDLVIGSGFGTAIQMRAGVAVKNELARIGALPLGEAVITGAGLMTPKHIIHANGPKFQESDLEKKLTRTVAAALKVANDNNLVTLAFPPMGAGFYGIPLDLCARVMTDTIKTFVQGGTSLREITICVMDGREFGPFQKLIESI